MANVKSLVANDENGLKVLTLKDISESSKVNRQPIGKRETKLKEKNEIKTGGSYRVRTPNSRNGVDW